MALTFTEQDLQQIASMGITPEEVEKQIENFRNGFPKTKLNEAATVENGGIIRLSDKEIDHYSKVYKNKSKGKK